jgi:hypothetical protein
MHNEATCIAYGDRYSAHSSHLIYDRDNKINGKFLKKYISDSGYLTNIYT